MSRDITRKGEAQFFTILQMRLNTLIFIAVLALRSTSLKTHVKLSSNNKNRLELFSRLFEESPAWFCSHLLAMEELHLC